jgi:hypothetical protein
MELVRKSVLASLLASGLGLGLGSVLVLEQIRVSASELPRELGQVYSLVSVLELDLLLLLESV